MMNLLAGVDRFVKFPDVQDQMGRTAVEMENATVQIISAYVIQGGRVLAAISLTVLAFQTVLVVDTATRLIV